MSETKAAFGDRTIRSFKNILYRYMEDCGYKYNHKLPQFFATMNTRNNRSSDTKPNHVKYSDFISILYGKRLRENKKPKSVIEDKVCTSKCDLPFRKVIHHKLHKNFLKLLLLLLKNLQHIQSKTNKKKL